MYSSFLSRVSTNGSASAIVLSGDRKAAFIFQAHDTTIKFLGFTISHTTGTPDTRLRIYKDFYNGTKNYPDTSQQIHTSDLTYSAIQDNGALCFNVNVTGLTIGDSYWAVLENISANKVANYWTFQSFYGSNLGHMIVDSGNDWTVPTINDWRGSMLVEYANGAIVGQIQGSNSSEPWWQSSSTAKVGIKFDFPRTGVPLILNSLLVTLSSSKNTRAYIYAKSNY
jgi:hypothetical protein